jgi:Na+/proline symporter
LEEYFLAGKKLPWWILGVSGMGWSLDITGTMLIISLLYFFGPRGLFIEFRGGANLALIFMMIWTGKWHRRSGCMTIAEWMKFRFGGGFGGQFARLATAIAFIIFTIGMLAYMVKGDGLFLSMFIPLTPFQCAFIMIGIATIYTVMSGFYGVVFTDLFQCGLIILGVIIVVVIAANKVSDGASFAAMAQSVTGIKEWATSFPQMEAMMPRGYEMYHSLFMFTVFLVLRNLIGGLGTGGEPQYFAAKNERECGKLTCFWSALMTFRWPLMISYVVIGIFLVSSFFPDQAVLSQSADLIKQNIGQIDKARWVDTLAHIINNPKHYPEQMIVGLQTLLGQNWAGKLHLLSYEGTVNAESIMPSVLIFGIPAGLRGFILVTLLAASMSTFNMTINKTAALFTKDIYQGFFREKASNKELLIATYVFSVSLVAMGLAMGYTAESINDIWGWIMMGLGSGIAVPMLLRFYWWRFNGGGFTVSMLTGLIASILQRAFWPSLPEQWQFVSLTLLALAGAIIGTLLTKPTDKKVLEDFYIKTRPFGFWNRFKALLPADVQKQMRIEHRNDMLAIPFVFCWQISMFMLPMQLVIRNYNAFWITLIILLISLIGMYKFWFKNLPPETA